VAVLAPDASEHLVEPGWRPGRGRFPCQLRWYALLLYKGVQPGGIYVCVGTARADSRRSGAGLTPRPQALHTQVTALVLWERSGWEHKCGRMT
jgi:hypothetical protein